MHLCGQFPRFFLHVGAQTDQEIMRVPSKLLFVVTALRCETDQHQPLRYRVLGFGEGRTFPAEGNYMMNKQLQPIPALLCVLLGSKMVGLS